MSIYWLGRDGQLPPANAQFLYLPFKGKGHLIPFQQSSLPSPAKAKVLNRKFLPNQENWKKNIAKALQLIEKKKLLKVVLARAVQLELDRTPDPFAITASLPKEGSYLFCVQEGGKAFLGATPERLFKRIGKQIFSEALAATRSRGKTTKEDEALADELLSSKKDLIEFSIVQEYIRDTLSPLCEEGVSFTPVSLHKTKYVQHLYSQCQGTLKQGVTDEEILSKLHPTPALCGAPKPQAFSLIEELEPFDRGLYGGVLGWHTAEESEYIVGIRSCLIEGKVATLFSGTGIVNGSDPEKEWEELNHKVRLYDPILVD